MNILFTSCININSFIRNELKQDNIGIEFLSKKEDIKSKTGFCLKTFFVSTDKIESSNLLISKSAPWHYICYYIANGLLVSNFIKKYRLPNKMTSACLEAYVNFIQKTIDDDFDVDIYLFFDNNVSEVPSDYIVYIKVVAAISLLTKLYKILEICESKELMVLEQNSKKEDIKTKSDKIPFWQKIFNLNIYTCPQTNINIFNSLKMNDDNIPKQNYTDSSNDSSLKDTTTKEKQEEVSYLKIKNYIKQIKLKKDEFAILQLRKTLSPNNTYKEIAEHLSLRIKENGIKQKFASIKDKLCASSPDEAVSLLEENINCKIDSLDIDKIYDD